MRFRSPLLLTSLLLISAVASASTGPTLSPVAPRLDAAALDRLDGVELPALDRQALAVEDDLRRVAGEPFRFAVTHAMERTPETHGSWERRADGLSVWRLRVEAPGAQSLNFAFSRFRLPMEAELSIVPAVGEDRLGPFTYRDQQEHGELWTRVLLTDDAVIELVVPTASEGEVELALAAVNQGYRGFGASPDKSGACNVDVVCPQGNGWRDQIRSVGRYTRSGAFLCSGAMINNTAGDLRPLFLTADHCGITSGNDSSVVVYWNYQNSSCRAPGSPASGGNGNGSLAQSQTGSTLLARYQPSDMALIELSSAPNPAWNVYWAGWDRRNLAPPSGVAIHHPQGQEKRISFENQPTSITFYLSGAPASGGNHVRVADWDVGTTEGGSSGSPLFNPERRIVGQLHGGFAACGNDDDDWYGFLATSWGGGGSSASRLSNWLDPTGSGASTLNGRDTVAGPSAPNAPSNLTATVLSESEIQLTWQDNSNNETAFLVQISSPTLTDSLLTAANVTMTVVTGLEPGTEHTFQVRARGAGGDSAPSNNVAATTLSGVPATPILDSATALSASSVQLEWSGALSAATGFRIEARQIADFDGQGAATFLDGPWLEVAQVAGNLRTATVSGLANNRLYALRVIATGTAGSSEASNEIPAKTRAGVEPAPCVADGDSLCLLGGRYRVEAVFKNQHAGGATGAGRAVPSSDRAGYFWFFNPNNFELVVKMLPGAALNGHSWLFYGALSDVEYWVVATDLETGETSSYHNPPTEICGQADLRAFVASSGAAALSAVEVPRAPATVQRGSGACVPDADTLCLLDGRFAIDVDWDNQHDGSSGIGSAIQPLSGDQTGFFWFFNASNIELIVKMIDGTPVNGKYWFFFGALSDVEYDVTVTDTETGTTASYHNTPGNICGVGDTSAFDG